MLAIRIMPACEPPARVWNPTDPAGEPVEPSRSACT